MDTNDGASELDQLVTEIRALLDADRRSEAAKLMPRAVELRAAELPVSDVPPTPQQIATHFAPVVFTGGPFWVFEEVGRASFVSLLERGLYPHSNVLDFGCGALRIGYWLINFLQPDRYFGIEPDTTTLQFGIDQVVGPEVIAAKRPSFDANEDLDMTVFNRTFDFAVARSIWTHTARSHMQSMLDSWVKVANPVSTFLISYVPAANGDAYMGEEWVATPLVRHPFSWIEKECQARGLVVREDPNVINGQTWLVIQTPAAAAADAAAAERANAQPRSKVKGLLGRLQRG
ncbi:MAG: hypothetical protein QOF21_434 [Actinomycetota bacterium]